MGPVNKAAKDAPPKVSEQELLKQAEKFILDNKICKKEDDSFNWVRLVIAKINLYGHKILLEQLKTITNQKTRLRYLERWRTISFENLDLLFQNLIRNKMTKVGEEANFMKVQTYQKYNLNDQEQLKTLSKRGEGIIKNRKVAIIIFVGTSSIKTENLWDKEFYKEKASQKCLFEIMMERLEEIGDLYGLPNTYIYYEKGNSDKVNKFIKNFKYGDKLHCCIQSNHPVLNLNGSVCLKDKDSPDILQMPNGSGDFYHAEIKGLGILQRLMSEKISYVSCVNCQNILEMVLDPYLVGLFDVNKQDYDLMYKCTYPENHNERIFKRVVMQNGSPKVDTIPNLTTHANNYNKQSGINLQNLRESPVWMNHLIFNVEKVVNILKSAETISYFPQAVNYKVKNLSYWNPSDNRQRNNQACYVFDKDLSDLMLNNLFRSKGIMVDREEEYLPVVTEKAEFSWKEAYKEYTNKIKKNQNVPFYERLHSSNMLESMIRSDQFQHNRPN